MGNKSSICGCFPFEPKNIEDDQVDDSLGSFANNGNQPRHPTTSYWNFCRLLCGGGVSIVTDNTGENVDSGPETRRVENSQPETELSQQKKNSTTVNEGENGVCPLQSR